MSAKGEVKQAEPSWLRARRGGAEGTCGTGAEAGPGGNSGHSTTAPWGQLGRDFGRALCGEKEKKGEKYIQRNSGGGGWGGKAGIKAVSGQVFLKTHLTLARQRMGGEQH